MPAAPESANVVQEVGGGGLTFGINLYHIRVLCESQMEGGAGLTTQQVSEMTPDQIFFRLTPLKRFTQNQGLAKMETAIAAASIADKDGLLRGRDSDGLPIKARIGGQSLASRIAKQEDEAAAKKSRRNKRRERKRRGRQ